LGLHFPRERAFINYEYLKLTNILLSKKRSQKLVYFLVKQTVLEGGGEAVALFS